MFLAGKEARGQGAYEYIFSESKCLFIFLMGKYKKKIIFRGIKCNLSKCENGRYGQLGGFGNSLNKIPLKLFPKGLEIIISYLVGVNNLSQKAKGIYCNPHLCLVKIILIVLLFFILVNIN